MERYPWTEEIILLKCPYYLKQPADKMDPYQNSNAIFDTEEKKSQNVDGITKDLK